MARFPVYVDADVHGPIVEALIDRGWNVRRAIEVQPEGTADLVHFEQAAREGRVLISNDRHMKAIAERWIESGRLFPGLIWWPRKTYGRMSNREILEAIESLAKRSNAFAYPIEYIRPKS